MGGGKGWKGAGCKKCFKVSAQGKTVVLRGTNVCPDEPVCTDRKAHFDIAAPGYDDMRFSRANTCTTREWGEPALQHQDCAGKPVSACDCGRFKDPLLRDGCNNFKSLGWDNPTVEYQEVPCPAELMSHIPCPDQWPSAPGP